MKKTSKLFWITSSTWLEATICTIEYLLDWLSFPIQTGQKTNVAVISQGGQGCGKSKFFVDFIGKQLYGDELFAKIAGGAQIGGDFNAHIVGKMYLAIEEPNQFSKVEAQPPEGLDHI